MSLLNSLSSGTPPIPRLYFLNSRNFQNQCWLDVFFRLSSCGIITQTWFCLSSNILRILHTIDWFLHQILNILLSPIISLVLCIIICFSDCIALSSHENESLQFFKKVNRIQKKKRSWAHCSLTTKQYGEVEV